MQREVRLVNEISCKPIPVVKWQEFATILWDLAGGPKISVFNSKKSQNFGIGV